MSPSLPVTAADEVFGALASGDRLFKIAYRSDFCYMFERATRTSAPRFVKQSDVQAIYPVVWLQRKEG